MDLTLNITYAISPAGVIALATLIGIGVIAYAAYRIQSLKHKETQSHNIEN